MHSIFKSNNEIKSMSLEDRKNYYAQLKETCRKLNTEKDMFIQDKVARFYPLLRSYPIEFYGEDNIPHDDTAIFVSNHSNSHDFFTVQEVFSKLKKSVSILVGSDCLSVASKIIFSMGDATMIDRTDSLSCKKGVSILSSKVLHGKNAWIFGEGTWNIHPYLPMQPIRTGAVQVSSITEKIVIPTIMEYVEVSDVCEKEKQLYTKCIVEFGKPIKIDLERDIITQTIIIQQNLESMRRELWKSLRINKTSIEDIDVEVYLNHTYLKKFGALGFSYNSIYESQFLFSKNGIVENEFTLDINHKLVPGVTKKK